MQFSAVASILAMATAAFAAPADVEARTNPNNPVCSAQNKQVCCNNGILNCAVQILGGSCSGNAYCCKTDAPLGVLINVQLLNCAKIG
ncbi:hydrophobin 3 precursor [Fusarium heterosporum]|uniref:Hydrophobin 3 n=1 Tax=Fusarium heterosporum TaxID=42747 RepID=A0A8H5TTF4_FUSHE|nr:hydrophobin 3 precursor [Fusarium heterosporum]